jgi:hypothetical protein
VGVGVTPLDHQPPQFILERTLRISHPLAVGGHQGDSKIIQVTIREEAAAWFRDALAEIEELTKLPANWDGYGAKAVSATAAMSAVRFLSNVAYPKFSAPEIVPVSNGGLQVEWHQDQVDLELRFDPDSTPRAYIEDHAENEDIVVAIGDDAVVMVRNLEDRLK